METPIPTGTTYVKVSPNAPVSTEYYVKDKSVESKFVIEKEILPGASIEYEYEVMVDNISNENETVTIKNKATATGEIGDGGTKTSNELNILAKYGEISVTLKPESEVYDYKTNGETIIYETHIENISDKDLKNIRVEFNIPKEFTYNKCGIEDGEKILSEGSYENGKAVFTISELKKKEKSIISLFLNVNNDIEDGTAKITSIGQLNNITYKSNEVETNLKKVGLEIKQTSSVTSEYVEPGQIVQYKFEIKNTSNVEIKNITFTDNIPDGLVIKDIRWGEENKEVSDNGVIEIFNLGANESVTVIITVKVRTEEYLRKYTLENSATLTANVVKGDVQSNKIIHTIQVKDDPGDNDPSGNRVYKISGIAWEDENENGMRDPEESVIPDVLVGLINAETLEFVENKSGDIQISETDENGKYVFTGLPKGKYIVIVGLDESMYRLTVNNKKGVDENLNSDIYLREYTSDGQAFKIPSSGDLIVENSNISNIDIGLIKQAKFDLKLDKFVNRIIVQNKKGTKTYNYGDATLAKIELDRKYINNTNVIIEYKIRVTNEGELDGYVNSIADYLPEDVKFNAELNNEWYLEDGVAYSASLANRKIAPGEIAEITLIVTKATTDSNTGIINNRAEIDDAYNELGVVDIDSRPGNNVTTEDDYGKADVILGIQTGRAVLYIGLTLALLAISGISIYFIKRKTY